MIKTYSMPTISANVTKKELNVIRKCLILEDVFRNFYGIHKIILFILKSLMECLERMKIKLF